jgi:Small integral membrane protein
MLHYALVFLVVGLIAAALGLSGVAGIATQISWILFVIAIILFVLHLVSGRRTTSRLSPLGPPRSFVFHGRRSSRPWIFLTVLHPSMDDIVTEELVLKRRFFQAVSFD